MDDITRFNQTRWDALARAGIAYARPLLDLTPESARALLDPQGVMSAVRDRRVLCLASGGGQQSAAFALLGAQVSVLDFSAEQLAHDRAALAHYGLAAQLEQGDMRDLGRFATDAFDVVWHAFSINFIPDTASVFDEVVRVLRPGGLYRLEWSNPFTMSIDERDWTGSGYPLARPYGGGRVAFADDHWEFVPDGAPSGAADSEPGSAPEPQRVLGPHEFNHPLSTVVNGLIGRGLALLGLWESNGGDASAAPGSWEHFKAVAPPYLTLWARRAAQ